VATNSNLVHNLTVSYKRQALAGTGVTVNPATVVDESGKQAVVTGPITIITDAIKLSSQQPQPPTPKAGCFSCFRHGARAPPNSSPLSSGVAAGVAVATGNDPKQAEALTLLAVEAGEVQLLHKSEQNHYDARRVLSLLFPSF
jgi:hypothetical protein